MSATQPYYEAPRSPVWRDNAACRTVPDKKTFFPGVGDPTHGAAAKAICGDCPVADACLEDALDTYDQVGIRAGLSEHVRQEYRIERNRARRSGTPDPAVPTAAPLTLRPPGDREQCTSCGRNWPPGWGALCDC